MRRRAINKLPIVLRLRLQYYYPVLMFSPPFPLLHSIVIDKMSTYVDCSRFMLRIPNLCAFWTINFSHCVLGYQFFIASY